MVSAARRRRGFAVWTARRCVTGFTATIKRGLDGLVDRVRSGRPASLSWVEQGKFASWVEEGADLARDGVVRFRRADLRNRIAAEFGVTLHERSVGKLLRRLNFRRLSVRPQHPQSDPAVQEIFKKLRSPR
jgi:transposase